LKAKTISGQTE